MADLDLRRVGNVAKRGAMWRDGWPVFLDGLEGLSHIDDLFELGA